MHYGWIVDGSERVDDVIVSWAPLTAVPAMDICCHGGVRVVESILVLLQRCGAPLLEGDVPVELAWPAPTTIEKEIIAALVRAKTTRAVRFLGRQRDRLVSTLRGIASKCRSDSRRARSGPGASARRARWPERAGGGARARHRRDATDAGSRDRSAVLVRSRGRRRAVALGRGPAHVARHA